MYTMVYFSVRDADRTFCSLTRGVRESGVAVPKSPITNPFVVSSSAEHSSNEPVCRNQMFSVQSEPLGSVFGVEDSPGIRYSASATTRAAAGVTLVAGAPLGREEF